MTTPISITKYRLKEIIHAAGLEPCDYEEVFSSIKTGEIVNMARIALAAMDAEPVAWLWTKTDGERDVTLTNPSNDEDCHDAILSGWDYQPLFTAPPAPVVPDEVTNAIEALKQTLVDCNRYNYCSDAVKRVEEACRAEMFKNCASVKPSNDAGCGTNNPSNCASVKDHQIRELVNQLRDVAVEYHGTKQLRDRIARVVRTAMLQGNKS